MKLDLRPEETALAFRLVLLRAALAAALAAGTAMSPTLWTGGPGYPAVPVLDALPPYSPTLAATLAVGMLTASFLAALRPRSRAFPTVVVALGGVLVLGDLNRLQPWFYQYMLMFAALAIADEKPTRQKAAWAACGLVLASIYFWSGLQKANPAFGRDVLPWLLEPAQGWIDPKQLAQLQSAHWAAPILEAALGLSLLIPKLRALGVFGATLMHAGILGLLGPWAHNFNSVVWPWNVAMPVFASVLFLKVDASAWHPVLASWTTKAVALLAVGMPALNFVDLWDDYLSASLYSGRMRYGLIALPESEAMKLAEHYGIPLEGEPLPDPPFLYLVPDGRYELDVTLWSYAARNVPPYPAPRYLVGLARQLGKQGIDLSKVEVTMSKRPLFGGIELDYEPLDIGAVNPR